MRMFKRLIALCAALACLIGTGGEALAISAAVKNDTRAYRYADTSSASVGVRKGTSVNVVGIYGSWAQVERGGVAAYMRLNELKRTEAVDTSGTGRMMVVSAESKAYRKLNMNSSSRVIPAGAYVTLLAVCGEWAQIRYLGVSCFILKASLSDASWTNAQQAWIIADGRAYESASDTGASIRVSAGQAVTLYAVADGWALIGDGTAYGYVPESNVRTAQSSATPTPAPTAAASGTSAWIEADGRVYESANASSRSVKVSAGLEVNLIATNGSWSLIERNGVYGYAPSDNVAVEWGSEPAATPAPTATPAPAVTAAWIGTDGRVYESASLSSRSVKVKAGLQVSLISKQGEWAQIEYNGVYGYIPVANVTENWSGATATPKPAATATPAPTQDTSIEAVMNSSAYTNEQKCYYFLTKKLGFSTAAACGILANIRAECDFDPTLGSSYSGLVQWYTSDQKKLKKWCADNGYDYESITGQLSYMYVELQNDYPKVFNYLQSVEDSAQGAYDAAYYFCYYYEIPATKQTQSERRGAKARDTYYPKYS